MPAGLTTSVACGSCEPVRVADGGALPFLALVLGATLLVACGPAADPCAGIDCGPEGRCLVVGSMPRCECSSGYHAVGSRCELITDAGSPFCGDGTRNATEICDGEDLGGATCVTLGVLGGGILGCAEDCRRFDLTQCAQDCGDGLASGSEECDGQDILGASCEEAGFHPGTVTCAPDCTLRYGGCGGHCGDGIVQATFGESCDGTDLASATCADVGYYEGTLACDGACAFDTTGCFLHCGDGDIQADHGELCDGENLDGLSCVDLGYIGGDLACAADCRTHDVSGCLTNCGDGVLDFGEVCDDGNQIGGDGCSADCLDAPGRVVWISNSSGSHEVWFMLDDGTNLRQLTFGAADSTPCGGAHTPRFSRDGALVAFRYGGDAIDCSGANSAIHVITTDGTPIAPSPLVVGPMGGGISFTRDATAIVYTAAQGGERTLRIIDLDGSTDAPFFDDLAHQERDPDAHPSLDLWTFSAFAGGGLWPGIFVLQGSVASSVVGSCNGCDQVSPRWSANGDRILFHRNEGAHLVLRASGLESQVLATRVGKILAFAGENRIVFQDITSAPNPRIALVRTDGSDRVTLTTEPGYHGQPDWHPGPRDLDLDGILDYLDNCPATHNTDQLDSNGSGVGDACEP